MGTVYGLIKISNVLVLFPVLGWKSKGLKSKGHYKSKGLKAFKGTKAKSYIHKGLTKRSAEPGLGWSWSRGHPEKGKCVEFAKVLLRLLENYQ